MALLPSLDDADNIAETSLLIIRWKLNKSRERSPIYDISLCNPKFCNFLSHRRERVQGQGRIGLRHTPPVDTSGPVGGRR